MAYYPRSSWTNVKKGGTILANTNRVMSEIYIHYPGQKAAIGKASVSSNKTRLEGYRRQHKNINGWADFAYNLAVDQSGNIYEGRGVDRQSGANGGTVSNRRGQAILVLVGNNEAPTTECIKGIKEAISMIRRSHPKAKTIRGHRQSPDASTACPGVHLMKLVNSGALEPGSSISVPTGGTSKPSSPSKPSSNTKVGIYEVTASVLNYRQGAGTNYSINGTVKKGEKYTITEINKGWGKLKSGAGWVSMNHMKLSTASSAPVKKPTAKPSSKAPAFPLPKGFYYGSPSGPVQSVSGRTSNSKTKDVVKGANGRFYSKGLKQWQAQMSKRTWTITADGRFGPATEKVVRQFQKNKGLKVDGKIGPATWAAAWNLKVT